MRWVSFGYEQAGVAVSVREQGPIVAAPAGQLQRDSSLGQVGGSDGSPVFDIASGAGGQANRGCGGRLPFTGSKATQLKKLI